MSSGGCHQLQEGAEGGGRDIVSSLCLAVGVSESIYSGSHLVMLDIKPPILLIRVFFQ